MAFDFLQNIMLNTKLTFCVLQSKLGERNNVKRTRQLLLFQTQINRTM